ncbi:hypothetical protein B0T25DRAFT_333480 [Lasiosphaeria hispida]|uniref:Uncharacterized protein n=1 Tax=Lasiosphaeria hispida TaxID=260671 RepID=A0AAJ0H6C8_9PEZI|nr:hypothetical protein B0T25DRAFT_333480 [Lasiosphaeria hispida]
MARLVRRQKAHQVARERGDPSYLPQENWQKGPQANQGRKGEASNGCGTMLPKLGCCAGARIGRDGQEEGKEGKGRVKGREKKISQVKPWLGHRSWTCEPRSAQYEQARRKRRRDTMWTMWMIQAAQQGLGAAQASVRRRPVQLEDHSLLRLLHYVRLASGRAGVIGGGRLDFHPRLSGQAPNLDLPTDYTPSIRSPYTNFQQQAAA